MNIVHIERLLYCQRCLSSVLELDARCDWQVMAPNTHHSFFLISHLCILTCLKLQVIHGCSSYRMTVLLLKTFLMWFRVAWEIHLESHGPETHWLFSHTTLCEYTASPYLYVYTLLFGEQLCMATQLTYLMTAYYTPNNDFTANNASFYKNKLG